MAENTVDGLGNVADLLKRFNAARRRWELWRSLHQEAYDFAAPERETFRFRSPGQRKNRHVFDSTAILGLEQFSNKIQASIIPSWQQWMTLTPGDLIPEEEKEGVEKGLEEATNTFFTNLNHSNFSTEISPALVDLGIGTGAILVEDGDFATGEAFRFSNVPLAELYPEASNSGSVESSWRHQEIEVRAIKTTWPGATLPQALEEMLKSKPESMVKIISGMLKNEKTKKYNHIIIHEPSKHIIFEQEFNTKRLIVFRWHVVPGETFGRGPILQMLPDIRTVNKVKQFILENAALQMAGVYTGVDDGVFNPHTVRIAPGVIIPVNSNNSSNPSLQALPRAGDIGLGGVILEDLQNGIKKALFADPLGEITDPVRTATEQMIRQQEMLKTSGASIGRLKSELIEPLVTACVEILVRLGKIPEIKIDGREVTLRQESPLAKAEDIDDFQSSQVWFNAVAQLPEAVLLGAVKLEDLPGYWADKLSIPTKLIRDETERKQIADAAVAASEAGLGQGNVQEPV
jgi:hypothetical protein